MGWSKATITQPFKININYTDFLDKLAELMQEEICKNYNDLSIECDDADGEEAFFVGSYDDTVRTWYCRATLESPEESDIDKTRVEEVLDFEEIIIGNAKELAKTFKVEIVENDEDIDWHDDDYDY